MKFLMETDPYPIPITRHYDKNRLYGNVVKSIEKNVSSGKKIKIF